MKMLNEAEDEIARILMDRDGVSYEEAVEMIEETEAELDAALDGTSCMDPDDVLMYNLGLEPDYLFYLL